MNQLTRILVTGATASVGRHVVSGLLAAGFGVRAMTRKPEDAHLPHGVDIVQGDLSIPASLDRHLDQVDAVFLLCRFQPEARLFDLLAKRVRHIVFLSSAAIRQGVEQQANPIAQMYANIERAIAQSGVEWTFLRPGGFASNSVRWWGAQIRAGDIVRWPHGAAATAPVDERDIASVAVRALTEAGHSGRTYVLKGPQSLTQIDQIRIIGDVLGRSLRFEEIAPEASRQQMSKLMPPPVVEILFDLLAQGATQPAVTSETSTHTFRNWVTDHAHLFRSTEIAAALPKIERDGVGFTGVSEWVVDTPERQRTTINTIVAITRNAPWPQGLLSVNLFASLDGSTVLNYAQWTSDEAFDHFARTQLASRAAAIDRAVPDIRHKTAFRYRLYRGSQRESAPDPGCVVMVFVEFEGPDEQRQKRWVDAVFDALAAEAVLPAGGISGHFHLSTDGTRVLNYACWTSSEAHQEALENASGEDAIGRGPKWREVRQFPGVVSSGMKRYRLVHSLTERTS